LPTVEQGDLDIEPFSASSFNHISSVSQQQWWLRNNPLYKDRCKIEKAKPQVRAKVEHPLWVIKQPFGHVKTRFRGLAKNTTQLMTLLALATQWMAHRNLLTTAGEVRL